MFFLNSQQLSRLFSGILRNRSNVFFKFSATGRVFFLYWRRVRTSSLGDCDDYLWAGPVLVSGDTVLFLKFSAADPVFFRNSQEMIRSFSGILRK
jgi:hypothetical protein